MEKVPARCLWAAVQKLLGNSHAAEVLGKRSGHYKSHVDRLRKNEEHSGFRSSVDMR